MANTIEQYGITWTFDKNLSADGAGDTYRYGQFANGDYWVIGPVNIVSITPETTINESDKALHGSMINPLPFTTNDDNQQGYDGRITRYDADLNVAIGVSLQSPLTVPVGSSLVSTISDDPVDPLGEGDRGRLQTAAGSLRSDTTAVIDEIVFAYGRLSPISSFLMADSSKLTVNKIDWFGTYLGMSGAGGGGYSPFQSASVR